MHDICLILHHNPQSKCMVIWKWLHHPWYTNSFYNVLSFTWDAFPFYPTLFSSFQLFPLTPHIREVGSHLNKCQLCSLLHSSFHESLYVGPSCCLCSQYSAHMLKMSRQSTARTCLYSVSTIFLDEKCMYRQLAHSINFYRKHTKKHINKTMLPFLSHISFG